MHNYIKIRANARNKKEEEKEVDNPKTIIMLKKEDKDEDFCFVRCEI